MALYSDLNQHDPQNEPKLYGIESIYQSIYNILSTNKGERIFLPEFGSDLEDYLFELVTDITAFNILNRVVEAIERWEPRVNLLYNQCSVTPIYEENKYDVILVFEVLGLEDETFEVRGSLLRES